MIDLRREGKYKANKDGRLVRDYLRDYYNSVPGSVHWQNRMVKKRVKSARGSILFLLLS